MKYITLILNLLLAAVAISHAQGRSDDIHLRQVTRNFANGAVMTSDDALGIFSNSLFISGIQQLAMDANQVAQLYIQGNRNTARLSQSGSANIGILQVEGDFNNTRLSQNGSGLLSVIGVQGNYNQLDLEQSGSSLQNLILLKGSGINFDILQNNGGVQVTQTGGTSIPLRIRHSGNLLPIIIRNN